MEIRLLGHLEASFDDRPLALGGAKQRAVLAMLGLEANRPVTADRLIDGLWGEQPPPSSAKMVQNYVWRLRKAIDGGAEIATRGRAYVLEIEREQVDVHRLERLVSEAARTTPNGDSGDAARRALALFRGQPLADVAGEPFAAAEIRRLEDLRLTAAELAIDADLAAGRHQDLVAEIDALLAANPLHEHLHAQLMLALYRCGRQADALEAYRRARSTLVEAIGVEPGPELQQVQAAILRHDPALVVEPAAAALPPELDPAAAPPLVGRAGALSVLQRLWRRAAAGDGGLATVAGAYGAGKTRLAAELARGCHREGAQVLYASGTQAPEAALAAAARARAARRPTLLVVDDADRAAVEVRLALHALADAPRPVLALATGVQPASLARLEPREALVLEPHDADEVRAIAGLYAPPGSEIPVDELLAASRGVARRVHEAATEWARREAARRVDSLAERTATGRSEARALEHDLAGSVVALQETRERLERYGDQPEARIACPYKGLAPFERDDAEYFFGREELVAELVAHAVGAPVLAVVGPSGSGKSSAVCAGLLPALAGGVLPRSHNWVQAVIRPGEHPLAELRRAERRLAPHERGVLVIDQFEELFTACEDERERGEFAAALLRRPRTLVVVVVRADFYGRCAAHPELARALGANHVLVGPMARDELRRAIERPAQRVGLSVEPELADALLADVEDQPGALPLLSTALLELWAQRAGRRLQLAAYARSGGVHGAVARLAEEAFVALDPAEQASARTLLLRLSDEDSGGAIVRRRIALDRQDADVVARLTERRLLTVSDGTVEVAHEALLREWPRLRGWLDDDAQGRRVHRALGGAARAWDREGRDPGQLYRGARLASALEWAAGHDAELEAAERAFLDAARRAAERAQRRLRLVLAAQASLLVVAVIAGAVALNQRDRAREQTTAVAAQRLGAQALASNDVDRSLLLARQGLALSDSVQTRGNLLATLLKSPALIGVLDGNRGRVTALAASGRTLAVLGGEGDLRVVDIETRRALGPPLTVPGTAGGASLAFDRDGGRVAIGGPEAQLLDVRTRALTPLQTVGHALALRFSPDGRTLLAGLRVAAGSAVQRFDARDGTPLGAPLIVGRGTVNVAVARDGRHVVTAPDDGPIVVRDARTLSPLRRIDIRATALALGPDDRTLLTGARDGSVALVDLRSGAVRRVAGGHDGEVWLAAFSHDGRTAATGGLDNRVQVWDVARRALRETLPGHTAQVTGLAFSDDDRTLFSGALDGKVLIWDLAGDRRIGRAFELRADRSEPAAIHTAHSLPAPHLGAALAADTSPDGQTLAVGHDDGTVSLVDLRTLRRRATLSASPGQPVSGLSYMPDGRLLVGDLAGKAVLLDPRGGAGGRRTAGLGMIVAPSFSRDARLMAGVNSAGQAVIVRRPPAGPARTYPGDAFQAALHPDGRSLAVATSAGVEIADVATLRRRTRLAGAARPSLVVRFSPDGRYVAAGGADGLVRLWSTDTWKPVSAPLRAQARAVLFLAISPDSRTLAAGGDDGSIRLFDIGSQQALGAPLPVVPNGPAAPLFTPDGAHLLAISGVRGYLWDVRPAASARRACAVAGRKLTRAEWRDALPERDYEPAC